MFTVSQNCPSYVIITSELYICMFSEATRIFHFVLTMVVPVDETSSGFHCLVMATFNVNTIKVTIQINYKEIINLLTDSLACLYR